MSITNNSIAARNSRYLQSLIEYVLDVKPYRTKLAKSGAVSEEYVFSEIVNANISESQKIKTILGADILASTSVAAGVRARMSDSWVQDLVSDGVRRIWPMPNVTIPKMASQSSREKFVVGIDDYLGIPGLTLGALDQRRWDFKGVTDVRANDEHQQDSIDYFLSHGAFSFDVVGSFDGPGSLPPTWIRRDLNEPTDDNPTGQTAYNAFNVLQGPLVYNDVAMLGGTLENITGATYEEFYAVCTSVSPGILTVYSPNEVLPLGTVTFGDTFTLMDLSSNIRIQFTFSESLGQTEDVSTIGDRYDIVPAGKIVLHPNAQTETWSLIKVNPIGLTQKPVFTPIAGPGDSIDPRLEIHVQSIEHTVASDWLLTFNGDGTYELVARDATTLAILPGYPVTVSLVDGCSYRDDNIAFTIIPTVNNYGVGDTFSWGIGALKPNYKVFGSSSGWTVDVYTGLDAQVGKWFWNGSIGFKIPKLEMFVEAFDSTISVLNVMDESWTEVAITAIDGIADGTVLNNLSFQNGVFLAVGEGQIQLASTNGTSWTDDIPSLYGPPNILYNPTTLLLVPGRNGVISTSQTGATWSYKQTGVNANLNDYVMVEDFFLAGVFPNVWLVAGDSGSIASSSSTDGWFVHTTGTNENLHSIIWTRDGSNPVGCFIAVGDNGVILRSPDRLTWTSVNATGNVGDLRSVIHVGGGELIAVGHKSTILRSTDDGLTWSDLNQFPGGYAEFSDVAYGAGLYVAVSTNGTSASSTDGVIWTSYASNIFNSIQFGNGVFVGVGGSLNQASQFTAATDGSAVSIMAEPSTYTITFTKACDPLNSIAGEATVYNNILGYGKNLKTGEEWSDKWIAFTLNDIPGQNVVGDKIRIHLAPSTPFPTNVELFNSLGGYEVFAYEIIGYDSSGGEQNAKTALGLNTEMYPLFHSHGAVIFPNVSNGTQITIDKAFEENITFKILNASTRFPELGAIEDSIPLYFKYSDIASAINDYDTTLTAPAEYSDFAPFIEAFSGATGERVFYIVSPRLLKTNQASQSRLVIDQAFFTKYLSFNTPYSIAVYPQDSYGQVVRVKMTEAFKAYWRESSSFDDSVVFEFSTDEFLEFSAKLNFGDDLDSAVTDDEFNVAIDGMNITTVDGDTSGLPETFSSSIAEGLSISMTAGEFDPEYPNKTIVSLLYDFDNAVDGITVVGPVADVYSITLVNAPLGPVNLTVAPESDLLDVTAVPTAYTTYMYLDEFSVPVLATDTNALTFTPPLLLTAPFRLWLT